MPNDLVDAVHRLARPILTADVETYQEITGVEEFDLNGNNTL